jgi:hypothetical protein
MRKFGEREVPKPVASKINAEEFAKSQAYQQDKLSFDILQSYLGNIEQLFFVGVGLLAWAWDQNKSIATSIGFTGHIS